MSSVTQPSQLRPGTVAYFGGTNPPDGWIKANGAVISRINYANLFAAIGTTYGAGDGVSTFAVPDLRGEFVRGFDDGRGVDAGRAMGSAQAGDITTSPFYYGSVAVIDGYVVAASAGNLRPRNVALLACIKY